MRSRTLFSIAMIGWSSAFAFACNETTPPAVAPVTTVSLDAGAPPAVSVVPAVDAAAPVAVATPDPVDAGPAATATTPAGGEFFACATDSDCTVVPRNSCCNNGFMEAVNKQQADAYKASFTCEKKRRICPQFRIKDSHTSHCTTDTHKCELVRPDGGAPLPAMP